MLTRARRLAVGMVARVVLAVARLWSVMWSTVRVWFAGSEQGCARLLMASGGVGDAGGPVTGQVRAVGGTPGGRQISIPVAWLDSGREVQLATLTRRS